MLPPLDKMIPGEIPGFLESPYYELATIIEKWGPLRVRRNISLFHTAEYFQGLEKDVLITKERQLAASMVAWPLLHALNQAEKRADTLENENEMLRNRTEKLEQELNILKGKKKTTLHPLLGQVRSVSVDNEQIFEATDLVEQGNKNSKADLEAPLMTDSLQLCPVITQKTKKVQDIPARVPPDQWPPAKYIFM